jgi:hypothetical protein
VRTVRAECLDCLLIMNERHLERTLGVVRGASQSAADSSRVGPHSAEANASVLHARTEADVPVCRRDRLGGMPRESHGGVNGDLRTPHCAGGGHL